MSIIIFHWNKLNYACKILLCIFNTWLTLKYHINLLKNIIMTIYYLNKEFQRNLNVWNVFIMLQVQFKFNYRYLFKIDLITIFLYSFIVCINLLSVVLKEKVMYFKIYNLYSFEILNTNPKNIFNTTL